MTKETLIFLQQLVSAQSVSAGDPNGVQVMIMAQSAISEIKDELKKLAEAEKEDAAPVQ